MTESPTVLLFDGVCSMCNAAVQFVLANGPSPGLKLASLQSAAAKPFLSNAGLPADYLASLVLVEGERTYTGSTAALRTGLLLRAPWPALARAGLAVPRPIRNRVYDAIAKRRYQLFGTRDTCRLPAPHERAHFLSGG